MRNGIINDKTRQVKGKSSLVARLSSFATIILLFITLLRNQPAGSRLAFTHNQQGASFLIEPLSAVTSAKAGRPYLPGLPGLIINSPRTDGLKLEHAGIHQPENNLSLRDGFRNHIFSPTAAGPSIWANGPPENDPPQTADNEIVNADNVSHVKRGGLYSRPENDGSTTLTTGWLESLLDKIWTVESGRRLSPSDGDGGKAIGPLQIHADVLKDVNGKYGTKFTCADLRDIGKAKTIARMYIEMWMERYREEIAARIFNGGPRGWNNASTDGYWKKICDL
jgi:hypothetical protein